MKVRQSRLDAILGSWAWAEFRAQLWSDIEAWGDEIKDDLGIPRDYVRKTYVRDYFAPAPAGALNVAEYERRYSY